MKFYLFVALVLSGSIVLGQNAAARMDSLLGEYAREHKFNGTVLVAKGGDPVLRKGYGHRVVSSKIPNDEYSIFQIGSVTKQFTAVAILKLQEEGKLSVNDKLTKYFPNFPNGEKITIRNLLTHTSGIFNYTNNREFMMTAVAKPHSEAEMIALFRDKPLEFEPGSKYAYSNSGYSLLGYIIQKVAKKPYENVIRDYILHPLGMSHSGFDFTNLRHPTKALGYFFINADTAGPSVIVDSTVSYSAGAMYSTVDDLLKWNRAIAAGKILKASSWKAAFTPFHNKYAYGWSVDTLLDKPVISHSGGIHGFSSYMVRYPVDDVEVILLTNTSTRDLQKISTELYSILLNKPLSSKTPSKQVTVPPAILNQYVGDYQLAPGFLINVKVVDEKLIAQATGQPSFELFAESNKKFFLKVVEAQVEFVTDSSGRAEKLILFQGGQRIEGKRQ